MSKKGSQTPGGFLGCVIAPVKFWSTRDGPELEWDP